jgi:hypothetical protein
MTEVPEVVREAVVESMLEPVRHVVQIATRRGPLVIWDCAEPCPWNLRNVIRDYNWHRRGIVRPEEPTQ